MNKTIVNKTINANSKIELTPPNKKVHAIKINVKRITPIITFCQIESFSQNVGEVSFCGF